MTLSASRLSPEAAIANAFHGIDREDTIAEEQPYHRHAAYLFAAGADTAGVAEALSVTPNSVRTWLRQGWFQERVAKAMAEFGGRDLTQLFINEVGATAAKMLELRDDKKTPPAVVRGLCQDILNRALGMPEQHIKTTATTVSDDPVAEAARLMAENVRLSASTQCEGPEPALLQPSRQSFNS